MTTGWKPRVGAGQDFMGDSPDSLWDKYQTRETKGAGALPTYPPHTVPQNTSAAAPGTPPVSAGWQQPPPQQQGGAGWQQPMGTGGEGGMGAGGQYTVTTDTGTYTVNASSAAAAMNNAPGGNAHIGGATAPAASTPSSGGNQASSSGGGSNGNPGDAQYTTVNGTQTVASMAQQLKAHGWPGNVNDTAAVVNAYATTTGGSVQPAGTTVNQPGNNNNNDNKSSTAAAPPAQTAGTLTETPYDKAKLAIDAANAQTAAKAEDDRHAEETRKIDLSYQTQKDTVAYNTATLAETNRHNQAVEANTAEQNRITEELGKLDAATKVQVEQMAEVAAKELEGMKEANAVQMEQMQEGNKILLQQGDQAFKDWQTRQASLMTVLSSALNNPWLQQLTGMAPPGQEAAVMGGGNIQSLLQKVLSPFDYSSLYGDKSQTGATPTTDALNQNAQGGAASSTASQPGAETQAPSYADWQSWSPFQKAAYRTNIEALGPGAWQTQQAAAQKSFADQGGSPDITPLAGASASPLQQIGQQMTASMFGETPTQWQSQQSRQWSQAQAPQVKQQLSGGVTQQSTSAGSTPESQFGL